MVEPNLNSNTIKKKSSFFFKKKNSEHIQKTKGHERIIVSIRGDYY